MNDQYKVVSQLSEGAAKEENKKIVEDIRRYGSTPVVYAPTRGMVRPPAKAGLIETIQLAQSVAEVEAIVTKGTNEYKNVSPGTIRKWNKVAASRIKELSASK